METEGPRHHGQGLLRSTALLLAPTRASAHSELHKLNATIFSLPCSWSWGPSLGVSSNFLAGLVTGA